MKNIFISSALFCMLCSSMLMGQIRINSNVSENTITSSSAFLDASSTTTWNESDSKGKGLVFPRVNLVELTELIASPNGIPSAFPTRMDGMVVYNIKDGVPGIGSDQTPQVKPGFYYYKNESDKLKGGHWVRILDNSELSEGVGNGKFWSLNGNDNVEPGSYLGTTKAQNVVMKVNVDKEGLQEAVTTNKIEQQDMDNYNPTKLILGNAKDAPAFTKVVIGGTPDEQKAALDTRIKNVQPDGQEKAANFKFVLEVFGKARFTNGIVTQASTYPDYVFDNYFTGKSDVNPDYKFKKLNEVEAFIKENNHLPGVTKIDDLAKTESGYEVDNTQLSIQTLEKVEELYLHLIEQQKEIQALKAQIAELKK